MADLMADIMQPCVEGRVFIKFSDEALIKLSPKERNRYLEMVRLRLSDVLENCRMESNVIDSWMIELYEHE